MQGRKSTGGSMPYGIRLHVSGEYACFTRPEMKVERVSYDVITPSAARGILEAIHWKPAIRWVVDRIHVLKPIRFQNIRRNEVSSRIASGNVRKAMTAGSVKGLHLVAEEARVQRAATVLRDVAYVIEAHFELTGTAGDGETEEKHFAIASRRAREGQCFHRPCLGTREFVADFSLIEGELPSPELPDDQRNMDLGWMLLDMNYRDPKNIQPKFFRAKMDNGVVHVPPMWSVEARA
jgi:CRISPR-associated protein Cas5d